MSIKSKEERKMSGIDAISITPDPETLWESDERTRKRHIQKHLEGQFRLRAVTEPNTFVLNWNRQDLYIRNGIDMGSRCSYIYKFTTF